MYRIVWKQNGRNNPETGVYSEHETQGDAVVAWYRLTPTLRSQMQLQHETETEWELVSLDPVTRNVWEMLK